MRKFLHVRRPLPARSAEWLVPVLTAIKLLIEIVGKVANCLGRANDYQLRVQVSVAG